MTPLELQILIHCYITLTEHPNKDAPAVKEAFNKFKADGIIEPTFNRLTEKGRAWLEVILNTPCPKCWCEKTEPQPIIYGMMPNEINFCPQCSRKLGEGKV